MWFCCGCPGIGGVCVWGVGEDSVWGFHRSQSQCRGTQLCVPMTPAHPANSKNPVLRNPGGLGPAAPGGSLETQNLGSAADLLSLRCNKSPGGPLLAGVGEALVQGTILGHVVQMHRWDTGGMPLFLLPTAWPPHLSRSGGGKKGAKEPR